MYTSKNCNLYKMTPKELVAHGELVNETGGFFIVNGAARILRLLSANRRNYPVAMSRESWRKRNDFFTEKGILIRCVQEDETSSVNVLHYLVTGEAKLEFTLKRQFFFVPLIMCLKVFMDYSDQQIFTHLTRGREKDMYYTEKIKIMMRELQAEGLFTQSMCKAYVGKSFRHKVSDILPEWYSDEEVCEFLFHHHVLTHLRTSVEKYHTLCLTVIMEHLNRMRDLSHLRAIHRGAYFVDMKTIEPRRLTGEAWGFICPVHTPDGAPCGLLNHLAENCVVVTSPPENPNEIRSVLNQLGMTAVDSPPLAPHAECLEVMLDGSFIGYIRNDEAEEFALKLRTMKARGEIFKYTEIVLIPRRKFGGQYAGLFLATSITRMMRPVINLATNTVEYVGTLEQLYLNVAVSPEGIEEGIHTHLEVSKTAILSNIGKLVPFSDCNPNPRNMYQCQMGKQTMGTPFHNWRTQTANKVYRLQYPQVPLVRNAHYDKINMEEFCMGFNAVVAIISYTGYDMEDAMVLNKCSMERGLAHGQIYKTEVVDLVQRQGKRAASEITHMFRRNPQELGHKAFLDKHGLPHPGTQLTEGDPYYCVYDLRQRTYRLTKYKGEDCVVDKYTIMAASIVGEECQRACITIRIKRNPIIGDKFASRSGQKGIMSRLYPVEDLPFSERGIMPDIIFNPHGIPSRMTAGKLIELVAGKSAAEFGKSFDSTPFEFSDENPAVDYFGKILEKAGFNYYGEDVLYSGTDGRMLDVQIFEGIIYYQRLRHMTADKWQVRATGAIDTITRQPVKGRKRGGAIRFGEMERDCLISHGAVYTLKDRLLDCSDCSTEWVCDSCGGMMSPSVRLTGGSRFYGRRQPECAVCGPDASVRQINLPYAFKYLVAELASVGINTKMNLKSAEDIIAQRPRVEAKQA
ncbi:DNA-directed RNA polymerase I subunit RPA2-like [Penaeus chinensis]|uniref:DNA-directed RNA polymerase I subunit RPA2-like n=1 Tax=Penaeus chinensis TaxID=139456 RepID=UPI001FB659DA|nr:DNA-directed RNA polymerase I subunit RPA2-like [Penaeus chinensis]